ncbi:MAG TPA: TlpA disulfide reductase family protein [Burkholderiales bacterium]|nr:TlpA disulfide reductase family protein [Burkholderiales bacterium]
MAFVSSCRSATRFAGMVAAACATAVCAAQIAQVDRPAPELDVRLLSGKVLKAKELRGKVVVNVIWATWSPAARMELPDVQRLYREYRDKGLEVVALSIDEHPGEVREFWRKRDYSFPVAMRSDAFFDHYGRVSTTPMFYIVDRQGTLRYRVAGPVGSEKLEALLKPLIAERPPGASIAKKY